MPHELGHTRPRPTADELRGKINDENTRQRIALGLVGPDTVQSQLAADPGLSVVDPAVAAQLATTEARQNAVALPGPGGNEIVAPVSASVVGESAPAPAPAGNPFAGRSSFGQNDIPALVERANQNLQVVPPGVSPFGFPRPTGPPQGSNRDARSRRRLERAVDAAVNSVPQLQFGQSIAGNMGRSDLRQQSLDKHQARLQAGNAASGLLSELNARDDARAGATQTISDAQGNAFFVNPVTQQVTPALAGPDQQLQLPQDPRLAGRDTAVIQNSRYFQKELGVSPEVAVGMATMAKSVPRETAIVNIMGKIKSDFNTLTPDELRAEATKVYEALPAGQSGQGGGTNPTDRDGIRSLLQ